MDRSGDILQAADGKLQVFVQLLSDLPWSVSLAIVFVPAILALFSGSKTHVLGALLLSAATLVLLVHSYSGNADTGCAILAYCGALVLALNGYAEKRKAREAELRDSVLERMREESRLFLDALDRRAQLVDQAKIGEVVKVSPKMQESDLETRSSTTSSSQ